MSDIRANTISDAAGTGPIDLHKQSAAKAFGTCSSSPELKSPSLNISSLVDTGTGHLTFNITNAFTGTWYTVLGTGHSSAPRIVTVNDPQTGSFDLYIHNEGGTNVNTGVRCAAFGDLA